MHLTIDCSNRKAYFGLFNKDNCEMYFNEIYRNSTGLWTNGRTE